MISRAAARSKTAFLVRPWHSNSTSLFPPIMDGVEYIDDAIRAIVHILSEADFETRVDESVFIPGFTLRENLKREIQNADLVIVLLDGLRPNVVYELGFAVGWHQLQAIQPVGEGDDDELTDERIPRIVCLAENNATVLVRNLYPNPMSVPTKEGDSATIINPPLDMHKMFSDNSDLLIARYDRLNLYGSLKKGLKRFVDFYNKATSKQSVVLAAELDEQPTTASPDNDSAKQFWDRYMKHEYVDVVRELTLPKSFSEKKVLALSLMKLGRLSEAIDIWNQLLSEAEPSNKAGVLYHIGVCYYAIRQMLMAERFFFRAKEEGDTRGQKYLDRINRKSDTATGLHKGNDEGKTE